MNILSFGVPPPIATSTLCGGLSLHNMSLKPSLFYMAIMNALSRRACQVAAITNFPNKSKIKHTKIETHLHLHLQHYTIPNKHSHNTSGF